jgi:hypothetical protein
VLREQKVRAQYYGQLTLGRPMTAVGDEALWLVAIQVGGDPGRVELAVAE